MRISFKKTLALVLSVILVLSTFVGVLSISTYAADSFGTMTVAEQSPEVDENGNFTVKYDVAINNPSKIIELLFKPTGLPEGTTYVGEDNVGTVSGMDADDQGTVKLINENIWVEIVAGETNVQTFTVELNVNNANPATFTLGAADGTVKLGEDSEAAEYTLTVTPGTINFACKHVETSANNGVAATCTDPGKEADTICSLCGKTLKVGAEIPVADHTWNEGVVTTEPDCVNAGVRTFTCTVCNATKTEAISAKGHTEVEIPEVPATCTKDGYTAGTKCSVCDAIIVAPEKITAPGHTEGKLADNGDGTHTVSCTVCSEAIRTEAHSYTDGTCACGAVESTKPILDETLATKLNISGLIITEKFGINITVNLGGVTYDSFNVICSKRTVDATTFLPLESPVETTFNSSDAYYKYENKNNGYALYYFDFSDICFYEMNLPVDIIINVVRDGKTYYYKKTANLCDLAIDLYNSYAENPTANAASLTLMTDLLNLAAKTQIYFAEKGAENNALKDLALPNATVNQSYATDISGLTDFGGTRDSAIKISGLQMLGTPSLLYYASLTNYKTPADITMTVSYPTKGTNGNEDGYIIKTINGSELTGDYKTYAERYGLYYFTFDKMELYDTNKTITFRITATDGNEWVYETSMESYLASYVGKTGSVNEVFQAVAALGLSAHNQWPDLA